MKVGSPLEFKMHPDDFAECSECEDLRAQLSGISGALCDASTVVVHEGNYALSVRELTTERDAAIARAERAERFEHSAVMQMSELRAQIAAAMPKKEGGT